MLERLQRELTAAQLEAAQAQTNARLPASPARRGGGGAARGAGEEGSPPDRAQLEQLHARNAQLEVRTPMQEL